MAVRTLIIASLVILTAACRYDLDVSGLVYTPVPVNERFEQSAQWLTTHGEREITAWGEAYKVMVGSDSHLGPVENYTRFMDTCRETGAAIVAIAGDLCTGRADDYDVAYGEISLDTDQLFCVVPGNHDLYFGGWESFHTIFGPSAYTITVHAGDTSDLFIFLDTGGGTIGTLQLDWLREVLENERGKHRYGVVITHVNFIRNRFTSSTNILNEELQVLLDLFAQHEISLVIQGHDHKRYTDVFGKTTYITLDAMKDGNPDASFLEITVSQAGIEYRFIPLD